MKIVDSSFSLKTPKNVRRTFFNDTLILVIFLPFLVAFRGWQLAQFNFALNFEWNGFECLDVQKQPPEVCYKNMFLKIAQNVNSCEFCEIFKSTFFKNTSGRLVLNVVVCYCAGNCIDNFLPSANFVLKDCVWPFCGVGTQKVKGWSVEIMYSYPFDNRCPIKTIHT